MTSEPAHKTDERTGGASTWKTRGTRELFDAILSLKTREEAERFFRDLCTIGEIEAMAHRWEAARLIDEGLPYHEVARRTGASTTTVTRVAHWLRRGEGGYRLAIERRREGETRAADRAAGA